MFIQGGRKEENVVVEKGSLQELLYTFHSSGTETSHKAGSDLNVVVHWNYPVGSVLGGRACRGGSGMGTRRSRSRHA